MLEKMVRISFRVILFSLLCSTGAVMAQTPTPSPTPVNPTQQDATRPPGTERNQPVPEQARPTQNPTAPPGSQQPAPEAPPGTSITPQSGTPQTPNVTQTPTPTPSDVVPPTQQETTPG